MRPVNPEQDSLVKIKLLIESMNRSLAKRSDFILIRVEPGGERSPQLETFKTAFSSFSKHLIIHHATGRAASDRPSCFR